jgi:PAS domain S-box-containing protein
VFPVAPGGYTDPCRAALSLLAVNVALSERLAPVFNAVLHQVDDETASLDYPGSWTMTWDVTRFSATMLQAMPDAVIYSDAKGTIRFWNAGAARIFGFSEAEALGQSLDIIIPENLRQRHRTGYEQTMHTGQTRYGAGDLLAVPAIRKDGSRVSIEFTIVPFHDDTGAMVGIAAVLRDVTKRYEEMKGLQQQLRSLRARADDK